MMKISPKYLVCAAALTVAFHSLPVLAADGAHQAAPAKKKLVTQFRGSPPFKRELVSVEDAAQFARFEEAGAGSQADAKVWVVDTRGAPPFKRRLRSSIDTADFVRFEETGTQTKDRKTRRGPPGKITSRR